MRKKEIQIIVPSIVIDEDFLISLSRIINKQYLTSSSMITDITVHSEREKSTFEGLGDLTSSEFWPREVFQLSIRKKPKNSRDLKKVIEFYFNVDARNKNNCYCQLIGYDPGKIANCKEQIENLLDRYKNWYDFIFLKNFSLDEKPSNILEFVNIGISISFGFFIYRLVNLFPSDMIKNWNVIITLGAFIIFYNQYSNFTNSYLPYINFEIRKKKRSAFWNWFIGAVTLGLIVNAIIEIIKWVVFKG